MFHAVLTACPTRIFQKHCWRRNKIADNAGVPHISIFCLFESTVNTQAIVRIFHFTMAIQLLSLYPVRSLTFFVLHWLFNYCICHCMNYNVLCSFNSLSDAFFWSIAEDVRKRGCRTAALPEKCKAKDSAKRPKSL